MLEFAGTEAAGGAIEMERPQEIAGLLEVGAHGENFMDQIFNANDAVFAEVALDELVVRQCDTLLVDLAVAALVDHVAD